jgi:hypothetical protein
MVVMPKPVDMAEFLGKQADCESFTLAFAAPKEQAADERRFYYRRKRRE